LAEIFSGNKHRSNNSKALKILQLAQLQLADKSLLMQMYPEQFAYGHREILLDECGLDYSTQLIGNLQHGFWDIDNFDFRSPRYLYGRNTKTWVFSRDLEDKARRSGLKGVYAIGAPWLYLKRRKELEGTYGDLTKKRILVMPGHSQTNFYDRSTLSLTIKRAQLFREVIGSSDATVCLHPIDFLNTDTRNSFADQGFHVTCLGISNSIPPWSPAANRIKFLDNLYGLMSTHSHFVTDDVGTSLFYALNVGLDVAVYPEIRHLLDTTAINSGEIDNQEYLTWSEKYLEQNFSEIVDRFGATEQLRDFADSCLGLDCIKEKDELIEILDFRRNVYTDFQYHSRK
jgi:hypothetical protein